MKQVIAILNQKGGVGKTTTTINLGAFLAKLGKRVLIIDLDPQANATSGLGIDKLTLNNRTSFAALLEAAKLEDVVVGSGIDGLWLIPTNADLAAAEVQLATMTGRENKLRNWLGSHDFHYDMVIIDCPPSLGLLSINALTAASDVLIPVQTEYYAMEGLGQLVQIIQRIQQGLNPTLQILGILMTMYDTRTSLSNQVYTEIKRVFGDLVFATVIPRNVRLAEAPSHGQSILNYDRWSKGARAYKNLAKEVNKRVG